MNSDQLNAQSGLLLKKADKIIILRLMKEMLINEFFVVENTSQYIDTAFVLDLEV